MITIIGIAGSLRENSINRGLLMAALEEAPDGVSIQVESIRGIPLFNQDLEDSEGIPPKVAELKDKIIEADGLLLVTPEYNNSIPGVFKNAIDWLSRPPTDLNRVFGDKPTALMGASPGRFGTAFAQTAWLPVLRFLGVNFWPGSQFYISSAGDYFDTSGRLVDEKMRNRVRKFVSGFAGFISG